jgi:tetratricopeptide (TPR) repeat protein
MARLFAMVAFCTIAAFLPALGNGWARLQDDLVNFLQNDGFRGLGPGQLIWAFRTFLLGVYQPLGWIILEAQYAVFGLSAWGYHISSLLLHAVNAVLFMILLAATLSRCRGLRDACGDARIQFSAAIASLVFSVHPLRVQVVAWVSCQSYLPCAFFSILATLAYIRTAGEKGRRRLVGMLLTTLLYLAAVLSKAPALPLPLVFLVLDVYPLERFSLPANRRGADMGRAILEKIPLLLIALFFAIVAFSAKYSGDPAEVVQGGGWAAPIIRFGYSAFFYVEKTLWPSRLSGLYAWPGEPGMQHHLILGAAATAGLTGALAMDGRRWPGAVAAWTAYLVLLLPVSGLLRSSLGLVNDRYSYLPTMPLYFPLAYGLCLASRVIHKSSGSGHSWFVRLFGVAVIFVLMVWSWQLCATWSDDQAIFTQAYAAGGISRPMFLTRLGKVYHMAGRYAQAEQCFRDAVTTVPFSAEAAAALGFMLAARGQFDEGMAWLDRALAADPQYVMAYTHKGLILAEQKKYAQAEQQLQAALRINPYFVEARIDLARVLQDEGRFADAAEQFARALAGDPGNPRARRGLAETLR